MINDIKTRESFGYSFESLSPGSNKKVWLVCDYCGEDACVSLKIRNKSNKHCDKDACSECRYKKRADVSLARDGVSNSAQRDDVRRKISEKSADRLKSEEYKQKLKQTMMDKYGVENAMHSAELTGKLKETMLEKYGKEFVLQVPEYAKRVSEKAIKTKIDRGLILNLDGKTLPQLAKDKGFSRSHFGKLVKKYGIEDALLAEKKHTSLEYAFIDFFEREGIEYETQVRIGGKIADFRVGDLIIECDGLRWHSDLYVDNDYHVNKMEVYKENGLRPLFFRGNEIINKFEIVKSITKNALGMPNRRLYARKLDVRPVSFNEGREFVQENHLMGPTAGVSATFGLYEGGELISVLQVKRVRDNSYDIARFCSKLGYSVVGGFSRLLIAFQRLLNPGSISTFIDLRYGDGGYLKDLGFSFKSCHKSFNWTDGVNTYHRLKFRGSTGYEYGLNKIWDCGQAKYELVYIE